MQIIIVFGYIGGNKEVYVARLLFMYLVSLGLFCLIRQIREKIVIFCTCLNLQLVHTRNIFLQSNKREVAI